MSVVEFFSQPVWNRLSFTLVHFLWQGLAVALIACAAVRLLRLQRGNPRYATYLVAFVAMAACPLITFAVLDTPSRPVAMSANPQLQVKSEATVVSTQSFAPTQSQNEDAMTAASMQQLSFRESLNGVLRASLPWAILCWMGGVLILSVRLLLGFLGVCRWRRNTEPLTSELIARIGTLSERLGMPGFSRVFISQRAMEAVALGYLRPVVLLPAALATRMPPEMLEAVIAHELAHIQRLDLWVNLAQRVAETLLFYHPAVWWLSHRLRAEREICCDELAVKATGERFAYASALERAVRVRLAPRQPAPALGFGQDRKPTLRRVRHILGLPPIPPDSRAWLAGAIAVALLAALAIPTVSALTAASGAANAGESEQSRSAARTFNSDIELGVDVQIRPRSDLVFESTYWAIETERVGCTPSAVPLEIPACEMWWVHASVPVRDWDLLVREIDQNEIPGLVLSQATDSDLSRLTGLTELRGLLLHGGQLTDEGLVYLKNLTGLQWLDLSETSITDAGLAHLQNLRGLRGLNLSKTQITGAGLTYLKGLTKLQCLYLSDDAITNADTEHLKGFTALRRLNLSRTQITDAGLVQLGGLTGLQMLDLSTTWVTGGGLAHLQDMAQLQELILRGSAVAEQPLQHLGNLTSLQVLDLLLTRVADADLAYLENLTGLRRLDLTHTWITDTGLIHLKGMTELQYLRLGDNAITDAGIEHLTDLTQLQQLDLSRTQVTDAGLERLEALTELEQLGLSGSKITGPGLAHLEGLTKLQSLSLNGTPITGTGLDHLKALTELRFLSLRESQITDGGLAYLEGMTKLQILELTDTQITDAGLAHLKGLTGLEGVGLSSGRFTDQGLEQLKSLPNLKQVNFDGHPPAWPTLIPTEGVDREPAIHEANLPLALPAPLSQFPRTLNGWTGEDMEIPATTREYMRANFADDFINRRYINDATRQPADLYVVCCVSRPSEILRHQPLRCYAANGWIWDHTTSQYVVTPSNRLFPLAMHRFHYPPTQGQVAVACFYMADNEFVTEQDLSLRLARETSQDRPRYVVQVQISSGQEDSVRSAASAMVDAFVEAFDIRGPSLFVIEGAEKQPGAEDAGNVTESRQPRLAVRHFNSELAFDVFVQETLPHLPDLDPAIIASGPKKCIGHTPATAPVAIPAGRTWWVVPSAPVQDWNRLIRELDANDVPGLMLPMATDSDMEHLAGLPRLKYLDLASSQITDAGLASLRNLTQLERLSLPFAKVTNVGLAHLAGMTSLQILDLSHTQVTDAGLAHLKGMVGLWCLCVWGDPITDAGVANLQGLTKLQFLDLRETQISDAGLAHLVALSELQALFLGSPRITGSGLAYLKDLPRLRGLVLVNAQVTDDNLIHLAGMTKLQGLALSGPRITNAGIAHLHNLAGLQFLELENTRITNAGLASLAGMTQLQWLDLTGEEITDAGLEQLKSLTGLEHLTIRGKLITTAGERRLKQALPNLTTD